MMFASATTEWINAIAGAVMALTAVAGVAYAAWNLKGWLREVRGRDEYTFALRILQEAHVLRDEIDSYRLVARVMKPKDSDEEKVLSAHLALSFSTRESQPLFGDILQQAHNEMGRCVLELRMRHDKLQKIVNEEAAETEIIHDIYEKIAHEVIHLGDPDTDELGKRVENAVQLYEEALKPMLKG